MAARIPAGGLFLTPEDAVILDAVLRPAVSELGRRHGEVPVRLVRLAEEVHRAAVEFRATVLVGAGSGTSDDVVGSVARVSAVTDRLTVQQAARIAQCSESFLRRMARRGVLQGTRGRGGGWVLDGGSFAVWLAERHRHQEAA